MKPVDQTKFRGDNETPSETGNCMQACWASLLELELDEVPHFAEIEGDAWYTEMINWLDIMGYGMVMLRRAVDGCLGIMTGKSPRGDFLHCVVAEGRKMVHDPHPSRAGLADGGFEWWYLVTTHSIPENPLDAP